MVFGHREYAMQVADTFQKFHDFQKDDFRIPPVTFSIIS